MKRKNRSPIGKEDAIAINSPNSIWGILESIWMFVAKALPKSCQEFCIARLAVLRQVQAQERSKSHTEWFLCSGFKK